MLTDKWVKPALFQVAAHDRLWINNQRNLLRQWLTFRFWIAENHKRVRLFVSEMDHNCRFVPISVSYWSIARPDCAW
jgi:hypothetical protein